MQYTFTNNGDVHYIASMSFDAELKYENMKVEYSINGEDYSSDRYAVVVPANSTGKSYWIRISIDKLTKNASFEGDFDWLLYSCDEQSEEYLSYEAIQMQGSNGSYSVTYNNPGNTTVEALVIPESINGDPVTKIVANTNATAEEKAILKSVYVPASVTEIGGSAFNGYTSLEEVTFEQNEAEVSSLNAGGLVTIGGYAFNNCSKLARFDMPNTVKSLGSYAFAYCSSLTEIDLPDGITNIGAFAFYWCSIRSVKIPAKVSLANYAFQCAGVKSVEICKGVSSISWACFYGCYKMEEIIIPSSVKSIASHCFYDPGYGSSLKKIIIEDVDSWASINFAAIHSTPFYMKGTAKLYLSTDTETPLTDITIDSAIKINSYAFYNYWSLNSVTIGESVTNIGALAFQNCTGLTSFEIGSGVKSIGKNAFIGCTNLANVTFGNAEGWFVEDSATATSGTDILSTDLVLPATAATYLTSTDYYVGKYWICSLEN